MGEKEMGRGGFEPPTHGFSVRKQNLSKEQKSIIQDKLTPELTLRALSCSSVTAHIIKAWPNLPENVKRAIIALIKIE